MMACRLDGAKPGAIIWTNADILSIRSQGTYFNEILSWNLNVFSQENVFEHVICEMAAI